AHLLHGEGRVGTCTLRSFSSQRARTLTLCHARESLWVGPRSRVGLVRPAVTGASYHVAPTRCVSEGTPLRARLAGRCYGFYQGFTQGAGPQTQGACTPAPSSNAPYASRDGAGHSTAGGPAARMDHGHVRPAVLPRQAISAGESAE